MDQLYERMHQFFWEIFPLYSQDTTILCVGHNGTNKALIAAATGKTIEDMEDMPHLDNTSICILRIDQKGHGTIEKYNDADHLKA